jgi:hypothetical protein
MGFRGAREPAPDARDVRSERQGGLAPLAEFESLDAAGAAIAWLSSKHPRRVRPLLSLSNRKGQSRAMRELAAL